MHQHVGEQCAIGDRIGREWLGRQAIVGNACLELVQQLKVVRHVGVENHRNDQRARLAMLLAREIAENVILLRLHHGERELCVVILEHALVIVKQRELAIGIDFKGVGLATVCRGKRTGGEKNVKQHIETLVIKIRPR